MSYEQEAEQKRLGEIMERGRMAEFLLSIPEFHRFFEEVRKDYFRNFSMTNPLDADQVREYHQLAYALGKLQHKAHLYVGEAKAELEKQNSQKI